MRPYRLIDSESGIDDVLKELLSEPRFALDTEFHRERTYWPQVSLLQLAWPGGLVLIDALAADTRRLAPLFDSERLVVLHAAGQDLDALAHCCGDTPRRLFDTQIAAGFVGGGTPSLSSLHERELGVKLPKGHQLANWLERPLARKQLDYAAGDVARLLDIHDSLSARLDELGRRSWAEAEFQRLLEDHSQRLGKPEEAWQRVKGFRRLQGRSPAVARCLAMWRQDRAATVDLPVRRVLSDMAIVSIAMAMPRNGRELGRVRGVGKGTAKGRLKKPILAAVEAGLESQWQPPPRLRPTMSKKRLKTAAGLVTIWIRQLAREHGIEPSLLATRADVESLIRGEGGSRLARGWRSEMVGEPIRRFVEGEAALALEGAALVLEPRSRSPRRSAADQ